MPGAGRCTNTYSVAPFIVVLVELFGHHYFEGTKVSEVGLRFGGTFANFNSHRQLIYIYDGTLMLASLASSAQTAPFQIFSMEHMYLHSLVFLISDTYPKVYDMIVKENLSFIAYFDACFIVLGFKQFPRQRRAMFNGIVEVHFVLRKIETFSLDQCPIRQTGLSLSQMNP